MILAVWVSIAVVNVYLFVVLWQGYRVIEKNVADQARSLARSAAQHATATIDRTNLSLLSVTAYLRPDDCLQAKAMPAARRQFLENLLKQHQSRTAGIVSMSLTDADGYVFANSVGVNPGLSLGDRKYFLELKNSAGTQLVVSDVIKGRVSGKWGIQIARRIDLPDGTFAGMIVANLGLTENFERFYASIDLGPGTLISLRDGGNRILVRYPVVEETLGKVLTGSAGVAAVLTGDEESIVTSKSPIDHVVRITATQKLPRLPIFAIAGISKNAALQPWFLELVGAILVMLATILGASLITRMARLREASLLELAEAKDAAETASAMKTRFLTAASHDLRQPIQAINLFLHSLERTGLRAEQAKIAHHLFMSAHSLGEVLNALLDISKIDAGFVEANQEATDIAGILHRIGGEMAPMAAERHLKFKVRVPRGSLEVMTDPYLLAGILRNILGNAIKYTEQGGVLVGVRRRNGRAVIQVWDTGIGIAPEHMKHVFEEFFQVGNPERDKGKGLGLGLSIVKRLAGLIDAEVRCHSRSGRGTLFEVGIPRVTRLHEK